MTDFVHLHNHSFYSLMDGYNSLDEQAERIVEIGGKALAVTDHGTLSSHRDLQIAAKKHGIKPILGLEAYFSPTDRHDKRPVKKREDNTQLYNHLIILAKDQAGLENLNTLSTIAWTEGYYYKPRIDKEILTTYKSGLIVLSGCLNGLLCKAIEREDAEEARQWMDYFSLTFEDDFYVEIQPHNPIEMNRALIKLAKDYGVKVVVTADAHFAKPEQRAAEETMLILSTKPKQATGQNYETVKHLPDPFDKFNALYPERPISFEHLDVYLMSADEIADALTKQGLYKEEYLTNTVEIADKVGEYNFYEGLDLLPRPKNFTKDTLRQLCYAGLKERGLDQDQRHVDRLESELSVVMSKKGYVPYFLIVHDIVNEAKRRGIRVGPGRGSAAGSEIVYALGITDIDPIENDLLFFRFISPERADPPDIDLDFEDRRRGEMKEYARKRFKHVANISTYGKFQGKQAVRDAAKVFGVPLGEVDAALKNIFTTRPEDFIDEWIKTDQAKIFNNKYPEVLEYARKLQGRIRSVGMHAGGVVISKSPIEQFAPVETRTDPDDKVSGRVKVITSDMVAAEEIGLIKDDFLGLKTLSVITDALNFIKDRTGKDIELPSEYTDEVIFNNLSNGFTVGVFQAEAAPYTKLLKEMKVRDFEDLAASTALVRPGAMNTVGAEFVARAHGKKQVRYAHELLEPFTKNTYGVIVYQEQVMLACMRLGGMSEADANKVRRIIGKKKDPKEFEAYKNSFIEGASKHVHKAVAEGLWHDFEAHAGYSFNRSHAIAYSRITYWTAWLKHYYPLEFMTALLKNEEDKDNRTLYLIEAKRLKLNVKLPHINYSDADFSIKDDSIAFGLTSLKYLSDVAASKIMKHRPFDSYGDLLKMSNEKFSGVNSRVIAAMNKVGMAAMWDNPRTGQESENYYEYLGVPKFNFKEFPESVTKLLRPVDEFDSDETFIVRALVVAIKRGKGWSRIDFIDETGRAGCFHAEETKVQEGQMYFFLISKNRIQDYIDVDSAYEAIGKGSDNAFINFLLNEDLGTSPGRYYVIQLHRRKTKANKMMGHLLLANRDREMREILVFPKQFAQTYSLAKPGSVIALSMGKLDDGAYCVRSINE